MRGLDRQMDRWILWCQNRSEAILLLHNRAWITIWRDNQALLYHIILGKGLCAFYICACLYENTVVMMPWSCRFTHFSILINWYYHVIFFNSHQLVLSCKFLQTFRWGISVMQLQKKKDWQTIEFWLNYRPTLEKLYLDNSTN